MSSLNLEPQHLWFNHLYQTHHCALLSWFRSKLGQHHQAEDLSHEVFYRILKNHQNHHLIQEPKAWLIGIAKHVAIDFWRRQHIEQLYLDALAQLPEQYHPSAEQEVCIQESIFQLHCVLEQLPHRAAQVFLMSQLDGLTYAQIATQLHISSATVKRDMKQAFIACFHLYNDLL